MDSRRCVTEPAFLLRSKASGHMVRLNDGLSCYSGCEVWTRQLCLLATSTSLLILCCTVTWIASLCWCVQLPSASLSLCYLGSAWLPPYHVLSLQYRVPASVPSLLSCHVPTPFSFSVAISSLCHSSMKDLSLSLSLSPCVSSLAQLVPQEDMLCLSNTVNRQPEFI